MCIIKTEKKRIKKERKIPAIILLEMFYYSTPFIFFNIVFFLVNKKEN